MSLLSSAHAYIFMFYAECYRVSTTEYGALFIYDCCRYAVINPNGANTRRINTD